PDRVASRRAAHEFVGGWYFRAASMAGTVAVWTLAIRRLRCRGDGAQADWSGCLRGALAARVPPRGWTDWHAASLDMGAALVRRRGERLVLAVVRHLGGGRGRPVALGRAVAGDAAAGWRRAG